MMSIELDTLYNMDFFDGFKEIPDNSIDMILCDMPYNITDAKYDKNVIDLPKMWGGRPYLQRKRRYLPVFCTAVYN